MIEMTIVARPYLLDFADAYLDARPEFPDDVLEQWHAERTEEFGEKRWQHVLTILAIMRRRYGIHLTDVSTRNITFGEGEA